MKWGASMFKPNIEKDGGIILRSIIIISTLGLIFLLFKYVLVYFTPFIFAFLISLAIEPVVRFFEAFRMKRGFAVALSIVLVFSSVITLVVLAVTNLSIELVKLYNSLPDYSQQIYNTVEGLLQRGQDIYLQLPPEASTLFQDVIRTVFGNATSLLSNTTKAAIETIKWLPGFLIVLLIMTIATFFLTKDKFILQAFLFKQLSPTWSKKISVFKDNVFNSFVGFIKAQALLITITFTESLLGLNIIGVNYALLMAVIISMVDILPVLGTGSIYVPWAIVSALMGNYRLALSLLVLYGIILVVRYMIEPKLVGEQLGIHPVLALISMYVGLKTIGVAGVILGPAMVIIIKACMTSGILPKFK